MISNVLSTQPTHSRLYLLYQKKVPEKENICYMHCTYEKLEEIKQQG